MGKSRELARLPNAPVFSASKTSAQTFSTNAASKVIYNNEQFDTANCYDTATARFTPNVAGYYQINATVISSVPMDGITLLSVYRNGTEYKRGGQTQSATATNNGPYSHHVGCLVYLNGTTDYVEAFIFTSGSGVTSDTAGTAFFDGALVRMA